MYEIAMIFCVRLKMLHIVIHLVLFLSFKSCSYAVKQGLIFTKKLTHQAVQKSMMFNLFSGDHTQKMSKGTSDLLLLDNS